MQRLSDDSCDGESEQAFIVNTALLQEPDELDANLLYSLE